MYVIWFCERATDNTDTFRHELTAGPDRRQVASNHQSTLSANEADLSITPKVCQACLTRPSPTARGIVEDRFGYNFARVDRPLCLLYKTTAEVENTQG